MSYAAYIFDLDGTLLDTMDDFVAVTNATLTKLGYRTYTRPVMESFFGKGGLEALFREAMNKSNTGEAPTDENLAKRATQIWSEVFCEQGFEHTTVYPQVKETLSMLKAQGAKLAVLSNKKDKHAKSTIEHFFPGIFDAVHGEAPGFPRKPDPQGLIHTMKELGVKPQETAYVGDSAGDINVARAAKTLAVAVDYGYGTNGNISDANADVIISHFNQLLKL